jgi:outer membrane protein
MAKNLSLILNIVLLAAVGYLYYYNFSGKRGGKFIGKGDGVVGQKDSLCMKPSIAYVELDSLNDNITFIREKRKQIEAEQKAIESDWESGYKSLEAQKNTFLKKGAAITQDEAEKFQTQLYSQQQQIDANKQNRTQKLSSTSFDFMEKIQKKLKKFLAEYNSDKKYMYILTTGTGLDYLVYKDASLNITADVIKGMNEELKNGIKD